MSHSIAYDATHLITRLLVKEATGIGRVDLAYGRHFASVFRGHVLGAHYGMGIPYGMSRTELREIVREAETGCYEDISLEGDSEFELLSSWLDHGVTRDAQPRARVSRREIGDNLFHRINHQIRRVSYCLTPDRHEPIPVGAIYLNIAQHLLEYPIHFKWLRRRADVRAVFFVHDLLPLDYPEYFPEGSQSIFERRVNTMLTYGSAYITSTNAVCKRVREEIEMREKRGSPIHVCALPSPLAAAQIDLDRRGPVPRRPYFVLLSTIEPRKNHLLILNIWREFASQGGEVPALVLVGGRGWEHEQVADMIDRCEAIRPYVFETSRLSSKALSHILMYAQAVLMPSIDEGYGLPVVEALSLGTPVIASNITVFQEITQRCATLIDPLDGLGWRDAIKALGARESGAWVRAQATAAGFHAPTWSTYFEGVEGFLATL